MSSIPQVGARYSTNKGISGLPITEFIVTVVEIINNFEVRIYHRESDLNYFYTIVAFNDRFKLVKADIVQADLAKLLE